MRRWCDASGGTTGRSLPSTSPTGMRPTDIRSPPKDDLAETVASGPDQEAVVSFSVDAADHDAVAGVTAQAMERFGRVDAAVAAAG